ATLSPINNTLLDGNRTVKLKLQNLSTTLNGQASLGAVDNTATIVDEDALPAVANISGVLFTDYNANGKQDAGETGLGGRTVFLDQNNNGIADANEVKATTGAGGAYSFTSVTPGTYKLRLQTLGFETGVGVNGQGVDLVLAAR